MGISCLSTGARIQPSRVCHPFISMDFDWPSHFSSSEVLSGLLWKHVKTQIARSTRSMCPVLLWPVLWSVGWAADILSSWPLHWLPQVDGRHFGNVTKSKGLATRRDILSCFWAAETEHESSTWDHLSLQFGVRFLERRISMGKTRIRLLPSQNLKELSPSNLGSFHKYWMKLTQIEHLQEVSNLIAPKSWLVWWNKRGCAVRCAAWRLGFTLRYTMVYLPPESTREMLWNGWILLLLRNGPNSLFEFQFHFSRRLLEQDLFGYAQKGMGWWWMFDVDAFGRLQWRVKRHQQTLVFDSGGPREPPFWGDVRFFKSSIRGRCCNFMQLWSGLSCFPTGWEILRLCALDEVFRVTCQWRLFLTQFKLLNTETCRWVKLYRGVWSWGKAYVL